MDSRTYLVTGGAGFLGSHLCGRLVAQGHRVIALDSFLTGTLDNLAGLESSGLLEIVEADVTHPLDFDVDVIVNMACPASPVWYQQDPVGTLRTSVLGALNCLELARRRDCRVLQASTSEIYGDPQVSPQAEDYWGHVNPIGTRSCYDEGKRAAETLFTDYRRQYGVDARIVRIFNTYGPKMALDDGRVVSNFIVQALTGQDITIYGNGDQTRSFCYVDDLIGGLQLALEADELPAPVNLGNPEEMSMRSLAETVLRLTRSDSRLRYLALPQDDPRSRRPDISRARELLGWEPAVSLEEGLVATIEYFAEILLAR